ncbi:MAG: ribonuclease HI [Desulfobacteraceae bacterium]|nr:MAG: ribonuclease HI [Desulfobacteraceae bacterium]
MAADISGQPIVEKNKVLIKYQLNQEHKYWVNLKDIVEIAPDSLKRATQKPVKAAGNRSVRKKNKDADQAVDDDLNAISIYTDGASSGNPGPSGIGVLMQYGDKEREISKYIGIATNNIAELTAVQTALMSLKRNDLPVRIYTDSSYVCGLLISGWKAQKNVALVQAIKELMTRFTNLKILKVKGHSGIKGNEKADQLATSAIVSHKDLTE